MNVYVVAFGERGEGHTPESAWVTFEQAKNYALVNRGVIPVANGLGSWQATMVNGVDEVWIYELPLRGGDMSNKPDTSKPQDPITKPGSPTNPKK